MSADLGYLRDLGPSALLALDRLIPRLMPGTNIWARAIAIRSALAAQLLSMQGDWRSWSWRTQRLKDYLAMEEVVSAPPTRHNDTVSGREVS
ncbi:hypothetical protein DevBK_17190 [Devosia sp. BK]|uniref:hypothetical protein n=1 Tax=Devosia sp. BK TaxID=2871706 RepID=UPI00293A72A0|nr:hypothetical protein [Devosia sp. BK]MDV3253078.1 hypothetical protein [Devosia sp. BK]